MPRRKLRFDYLSQNLLEILFKTCRLCKSTQTAIDRKTGKELWTKELCKRCYNRIIHSKHNPLRARIDGFVLYFKQEPRSGICDQCGKSIQLGQISRTFLCLCESGLNAGQATLEEILEFSKEYCLRCHARVHAEVRKAMRDKGLNL